MKKMLALTLALVMALGLCACGGDTTDPAPEENPAAETVEIPPVEDLTSVDTSAIPGVEDGVLTVGMECAYAPYNWTQMDDSNGAVPISNVPGSYANGYDVMIAKRICEAYGWELEIVSSEWASLTPGVQSQTMDANIAGQSMTADRMAEVDMATAMGAVAKNDNLVILNFSGTEGDFQFASKEERAENVNIGIAVRKGNTELKDAMDKVLSALNEEQFNALMDQAIANQPAI